MTHKLTIHFANAEDCAWALNMIERCRKNSEYWEGTPLASSDASILICALGRSLKTESKMTPEEAKNIRLQRKTT